MSLQLKDKDVMPESDKCFAQIQGRDVSCSSLIYQNCYPITVADQNFQGLFALSEAKLAVTNHLIIYLASVACPFLYPSILTL